MIQLHYLGGSSEITPFGNETGRTCGSEKAATGPAPSDLDAQPWETVAVQPSLHLTPGVTVDGVIRLLSSLCSLHSIPKLETCRISACPFMRSSGTEHWCYASSASCFGITPSLLVTTWSIPGHGWIERRSTWRVQGLKWQQHCAVFPPHHLCMSQVWCLQRRPPSAVRELMWHAAGHVFLQFYESSSVGFSLELQLREKEKRKKEKWKSNRNLLSLLAVADSLVIQNEYPVQSQNPGEKNILKQKLHEVSTKPIPMTIYPRILRWWTLQFSLLKVGNIICCVA